MACWILIFIWIFQSAEADKDTCSFGACDMTVNTTNVSSSNLSESCLNGCHELMCTTCTQSNGESFQLTVECQQHSEKELLCYHHEQSHENFCCNVEEDRQRMLVYDYDLVNILSVSSCKIHFNQDKSIECPNSGSSSANIDGLIGGIIAVVILLILLTIVVLQIIHISWKRRKLSKIHSKGSKINGTNSENKNNESMNETSTSELHDDVESTSHSYAVLESSEQINNNHIASNTELHIYEDVDKFLRYPEDSKYARPENNTSNQSTTNEKSNQGFGPYVDPNDAISRNKSEGESMTMDLPAIEEQHSYAVLEQDSTTLQELPELELEKNSQPIDSYVQKHSPSHDSDNQ